MYYRRYLEAFGIFIKGAIEDLSVVLADFFKRDGSSISVLFTSRFNYRFLTNKKIE
jgi:hypothetical protein